jgi:hypothetical protein
MLFALCDYMSDFYIFVSAFHAHRIFGRTLSLILENIENYLLNCSDVVGLLIMIKVRPLP